MRQDTTSQLVRLCSITSIDDFCDPATRTRYRLVNVVDAHGALIPPGSTNYPYNPIDYPVADGNSSTWTALGYVASYWASANGDILPVQPSPVVTAAYVPGACPLIPLENAVCCPPAITPPPASIVFQWISRIETLTGNTSVLLVAAITPAPLGFVRTFTITPEVGGANITLANGDQTVIQSVQTWSADDNDSLLLPTQIQGTTANSVIHLTWEER